jgi:hypothetical protein
MQSMMNLKIKFRESFRPFAPSVLREHVGEWFEFEGDSPYMLIVADVQPGRRLPKTDESGALWGIEQLNVPRSTIPAVTHVDYSARIQTVRQETNPFYYAILGFTADRLPGAREHLVQRPRRTHRVHTGRRHRCFAPHRHGRPGLGLPARKTEQAPVPQDDSWRKESRSIDPRADVGPSESRRPPPRFSSTSRNAR